MTETWGLLSLRTPLSTPPPLPVKCPSFQAPHIVFFFSPQGEAALGDMLEAVKTKPRPADASLGPGAVGAPL